MSKIRSIAFIVGCVVAIASSVQAQDLSAEMAARLKLGIAPGSFVSTHKGKPIDGKMHFWGKDNFALIAAVDKSIVLSEQGTWQWRQGALKISFDGDLFAAFLSVDKDTPQFVFQLDTARSKATGDNPFVVFTRVTALEHSSHFKEQVSEIRLSLTDRVEGSLDQQVNAVLSKKRLAPLEFRDPDSSAAGNVFLLDDRTVAATVSQGPRQSDEGQQGTYRLQGSSLIFDFRSVTSQFEHRETKEDVWQLANVSLKPKDSNPNIIRLARSPSVLGDVESIYVAKLGAADAYED
ncbi:MAG: hypothetical protein WBD20_09760 [Pirellulaceae bacterium]